MFGFPKRDLNLWGNEPLASSGPGGRQKQNPAFVVCGMWWHRDTSSSLAAFTRQPRLVQTPMLRIGATVCFDSCGYLCLKGTLSVPPSIAVFHCLNSAIQTKHRVGDMHSWNVVFVGWYWPQTCECMTARLHTCFARLSLSLSLSLS